MTSKRELTAYCAVSPNGYPAPGTISISTHEVWEKLRRIVKDPDKLRERGWKVALCRCVLMEFVHE